MIRPRDIVGGVNTNGGGSTINGGGSVNRGGNAINRGGTRSTTEYPLHASDVNLEVYAAWSAHERRLTLLQGGDDAVRCQLRPKGWDVVSLFQVPDLPHSPLPPPRIQTQLPQTHIHVHPPTHTTTYPHTHIHT